MSEWQPIETAPEGKVVQTTILEDNNFGCHRNTRTLIRNGRMWFYPDLSEYVYYTPTHWRPGPLNGEDPAGDPSLVR